MNTEIINNNIEYRNAIVSNIELNDGTQTQVITIFNNSEFNFEEIKKGIDASFKSIHNDQNSIKSIQTIFSGIENSKLKPFATFQKVEYSNLTNH